MPANLDSGMFVREPAWHGEGLVVGDYPQNWDEARKLAGLDWEPVREPIFRRVPLLDRTGHPVIDPITDEPMYEYETVNGHELLGRSDRTDVTLDVCQSSYRIIPNATMGELIDVFAGSGAKINTAGSLYDGRKVWALVELDIAIKVAKDPSETLAYLALLNSHDGSSALQAIPTNVRVVCANTWHGAELDGARTGHAYSFRHTKNWRDRIDEAKKVINFGKHKTQLMIDELNALADIKVTARQREIFVCDFVPMPAAEIVSERVVNNIEPARQAVRDILASPTCDGIDNTVYGLVQAAGEYLDHVRAYRSPDSYVNRTLLTVEPLKLRAKKLALSASSQ